MEGRTPSSVQLAAPVGGVRAREAILSQVRFESCRSSLVANHVLRIQLPRLPEQMESCRPRVKALDLNRETRTASSDFVENRRHARFPLEVDIRVYSHESPVVRGHTVDISESGISAMLREEIRLNEIVRLEFHLPLGEVEVLAVARQRNAFRYGFQFVEPGGADPRISHTCRDLAMRQIAVPPRRL